MPRAPTPTHSFALVVVERDDGRFLVVQELAHDETWYLPAGRVEAGEGFAAAAVRETLEESGVDVRLTGVLRVEQSVSAAAQRLRVFFVARPRDPQQKPKSVGDEHSRQARWVTLDELRRLPLRGDEVFAWCEAVASRRIVVAPLSLLTGEGAPP